MPVWADDAHARRAAIRRQDTTRELAVMHSGLRNSTSNVVRKDAEAMTAPSRCEWHPGKWFHHWHADRDAGLLPLPAYDNFTKVELAQIADEARNLPGTWRIE